MNPEQELVITPEIKDRLNNDPYLMASFHLGRLETLSGGQNSIDQIIRNENREQAWLEFKYGVALQDLFFTPTSRETWLEDTVNFATPEEIEHEFAFYLGANYISSEEYSLLLNALEVSKLIHSNDKRRDGLRRSLYGHLLPGLRVIFDNRGEIINDILEDDGDDPLNFFESVFTFIGHDWLEDIKDSKFEEYIDHFPPQLKDNIEALTHSKGEGVSIEEYAKKIAGKKRVIKFVKMIDRMVNHIDDIGKAPTLEVLTDEKYKSRPMKYLEETKENYLEVFRGSNLPLFNKFEQVLKKIERDQELSTNYLKYIHNIIVEWMGRPGKVGNRVDRYEHIIRMIRDLEKNSSEYGVVNSTGMVGAIFLHDFVETKAFQDKLRSTLATMDESNPEMAELLRYSIGIAYSSKAIEDKSEIPVHNINSVYGLNIGPDLSEEKKDELKDFKQHLQSILGKPSKSHDNSRKRSFEFFRANKDKFFRLRPSMGNIPLKAFRESQAFDIEGPLLRSLEFFDNIDHLEGIEEIDPTYLWRQLQECKYLLIPLIESFGLKGMAKVLNNKVEEKFQRELLSEEGFNEIQSKVDQYMSQSEFGVNKMEKVIKRVASSTGVIEFDRKSFMGIFNKFLSEGITRVTDIFRCRIVLKENQDDGSFMLSAFETIENILSEFEESQKNDNFANLSLSIGRPYESVDGEKPKLAIRISLPDNEDFKLVAKDFEKKTRQRLGIDEMIDLVQFVDRKTGYKDIKVVFMLGDKDHPDADPVFYEMIITDPDKHHNNTFGTAARVYKSISRRFKEKDIKPEENELDILQEFYRRSGIYAIMSTKGFYISRKSRQWLVNKKLAKDEQLKGKNIVDRFKGIITKNSSYIFP
ncbi:MAG TPA: hypothetical protein PLS50_01220 [Candidatus Dojkabacteria bacterium]|nr:hypothetical protein [Candidatus Dojkabacteria bacterium]